MSWIQEETEENQYGFLDQIFLNLLKRGPVPKHVAFIMDGNRRFARNNKIAKIEGHTKGFDKLAETLRWCNDLGIKEVTVYAFSIENFKRSKEEVEGLLNLAREKFRRLVAEKDRLHEHGVRVNVIGQKARLPQDLQDLISEAEISTRENKMRILNVAFSYTSREEITQAIRSCALGVKHGFLETSDITEPLIERCLYTNTSHTSSKVDLLIRTSGEVRLSDFLLWQSSFSVTYFTGILWPELSLRNFLAGIFYFQRNRRRIDSLYSNAIQSSEFVWNNHLDPEHAQRTRNFLEWLETSEARKEVAQVNNIDEDCQVDS